MLLSALNGYYLIDGNLLYISVHYAYYIYNSQLAVGDELFECVWSFCGDGA